jgi:hypothetical protein
MNSIGNELLSKRALYITVKNHGLLGGKSIPWGGNRSIIGTGVYGNLPVTPEVNEEAELRHIELIVVPPREACRLMDDLKSNETYAVLHCTC